MLHKSFAPVHTVMSMDNFEALSVVKELCDKLLEFIGCCSFTSVLGCAEDMEIDIPKIWAYFGELIGEI